MNLLAPFGKIYGRVMDARNALYDRGTFKSFPLGRRTISVGNLTTGGTGKTPLVALISKILIESGEKPCILTRGYGRENANSRVLVSDGDSVLVNARTGGDEPVELAYKLEGKAVIVADPDRVAAAEWALRQFDITTFILDDGFQHRRAKRDLDIVCIDATDPCGNGHILPAGSLRESFKGLRRADAVVITRTEQTQDTVDLEKRVHARSPKAMIFKARTELRGFITLEEFHAGEGVVHETLHGKTCAFSGIGNTANFFRSLRDFGTEPECELSFEDHRIYDAATIETINRSAEAAACDHLVTTAKDAVKLKSAKFGIPCYVAIAETVIDDSQAFRDLIVS